MKRPGPQERDGHSDVRAEPGRLDHEEPDAPAGVPDVRAGCWAQPRPFPDGNDGG
ncbi:hypothetical protein [Streptomyces chartreusis]|uniref:hypothetical protein n=1 Tax=Streptomyces chartreusis TaxID=1969 RepID=UPI003D7157ED